MSLRVLVGEPNGQGLSAAAGADAGHHVHSALPTNALSALMASASSINPGSPCVLAAALCSAGVLLMGVFGCAPGWTTHTCLQHHLGLSAADGRVPPAMHAVSWRR